jgi:hypothetical protein
MEFVKKILKCLIVVLLATITMVGCATESDSTIVESQVNTSPTEIEAHYSDSSTADIDIHLARQITSVSNMLRAISTVKRANILKNNVEYLKAGKVVNVAIGNFVQQESFYNKHRFAKSSSWLISLGILII